MGGQAVLEFFETSGRNLLAAESAAGVGHHAALSVVGTDRLLEERLFPREDGAGESDYGLQVPYTILRATQFFEFVSGIAAFSTAGTTVRVSPALFQPIAAEDVAEALADIALAAPVNGMVEVADFEACLSPKQYGNTCAPPRTNAR